MYDWHDHHALERSDLPKLLKLSWLSMKIDQPDNFR